VRVGEHAVLGHDGVALDAAGKGHGSSVISHYWWSMIFSENRCPLFGIMLYWWSMIFSENRCPLFGIML